VKGNTGYFKKNLQKELLKKPWGLFKNVQLQGTHKTELRSVYGNTLSGAVCSATQQTMVPFRV
jgi:hypothetical protein